MKRLSNKCGGLKALLMQHAPGNQVQWGAQPIVALLSTVPVESLGTTGAPYSNPVSNSAGIVNSASILTGVYRHYRKPPTVICSGKQATMPNVTYSSARIYSHGECLWCITPAGMGPPSPKQATMPNVTYPRALSLERP